MGQHLKSRLDLAPVRDLNADINFAKNVTLLTLGLSQIKTHKDLKGIADIAGAPPDGLVDYIRGLCPVHRLNPTVFRAIMRDGGLRSRYLQKRLQASGPAHAAFRRLTQHPQVAAVFDKYKVRGQN